MRIFTSIAIMALAATAASMPITPSARKHQHLAELMRSEGMTEHEISEQLSTPASEDIVEARPFLTHMSSTLHSLFQVPTTEGKRDPSGDIAPGSLESPQMLPRAAVPYSYYDTLKQTFSAVFKGEDVEQKNFGYEGKELEMRRPEGMRHWD